MRNIKATRGRYRSQNGTPKMGEIFLGVIGSCPMAALLALAPTPAACASTGTNRFLFGSGEWKPAEGGVVGGDRDGGESDYAAYKCREKRLGGCWRTSGHCPLKV